MNLIRATERNYGDSGHVAPLKGHCPNAPAMKTPGAEFAFNILAPERIIF